MAASNGMMAQENRRLQEEREKLEREIEALASGLPAEAAAIVHKADALMAEHGARIAELKSRRDAIDQEFGVKRREADEAREREQAEARARIVHEMEAAAGAFLDANHQAELALSAFIDHANAAIEAHQRVATSARKLAVGAKVPMELATTELIRRLGDRISGQLRQVKVPGSLLTTRIGSLTIPAASPEPAQDWRERETPRLSQAVDKVIRHAEREGANHG